MLARERVIASKVSSRIREKFPHLKDFIIENLLFPNKVEISVIIGGNKSSTVLDTTGCEYCDEDLVEDITILVTRILENSYRDRI